jgi:hypothetical protein
MCHIQTGVDYEGGDIRFIYDVKSQADCWKGCVKEPRCSVAVYYQNFCYLKHSTKQKAGLTGTVSCRIAHHQDVVRRYDTDVDVEEIEEEQPVGKTLSSLMLLGMAVIVGFAAVALAALRKAGVGTIFSNETHIQLTRPFEPEGSSLNGHATSPSGEKTSFLGGDTISQFEGDY